jgi:hypothetical protein
MPVPAAQQQQASSSSRQQASGSSRQAAAAGKQCCPYERASVQPVSTVLAAGTTARHAIPVLARATRRGNAGSPRRAMPRTAEARDSASDLDPPGRAAVREHRHPGRAAFVAVKGRMPENGNMLALATNRDL